MTTKIPLHINNGGDGCRTVVLPCGDSESLLMTPISSDHFRLEQNSLLLEAAYHDVIRASPREDGSLQFHEISAKSELLTSSWILSEAVIDSPEFQAFLEFVGGLGGAWERILGGMIFVHVPPEGANAVEEHLNAVVSRFKN